VTHAPADAERAAVLATAAAARAAAATLAPLPRSVKDDALEAMAAALGKHAETVLAANSRDVQRAEADGTAAALVDRLTLNSRRLEDIAEALHGVAALPDPVGEVVRGRRLPNGLELRQVRVPIGVIGIIYEARPNVTVDAAGLCLKSGNAVLLRGSSSARESNAALVEVMQDALVDRGIDPHAIQLVPGSSHESVRYLMTARGLVDLLIPRGGADLIREVVEGSTVPVIETGIGNCHVYVDADADLDKAVRILVNSKAQRPTVCNAAETVLVHSAVAERFLPEALVALRDAGVTVHGDARVREYAPTAGVAFQDVTEQDWLAEYYSLDIAAGVVESIEDALVHIRRYGSGHTEAIVTDSESAARRFVAGVDAAAVMVNASTRFTDGGEFGFGAEIGISTQKLHARGPMGLPELTSTTYVVVGDGHVRG
jgi:glutamate-5-semialdehyde dehydrogenase